MFENGSDSEAQVNSENSPSNVSVLNKYKMAGEIACNVLAELISKSIKDASVVELCALGDRLIEERTSKIFTRDKKMRKGIGFPTCVCPNNIICHFSPLRSDPEIKLGDGDVVKIDLGVHIDGFLASVAATTIVGASKADPASGRSADVVVAGQMAAEIALRQFRPNQTNHAVTDIITSVASEFNCKPVEGLLSYSTYKGVPEGENRIMLNPTDAMRKDYPLTAFNTWDVYTVDIFISTSDQPKPKMRDTRTTVFRRSQASYNLRLKVSRELLKQSYDHHGEYGFSLRSFEDEKKVRLGIKECVDHQLLLPYQVLYEKDDQLVSHFKFTVVVGPNGPIKVAYPTLDREILKTELCIQKPELVEILNEPLGNKNKKKKAENIVSL